MKQKKKSTIGTSAPPSMGLVEISDPPKIMTQLILPFLVSFFLCVLAITAFTTMFRNTAWFLPKNASTKDLKELQSYANVGDVRQMLEIYDNAYLDPYDLTKLLDARSQQYVLIDLRDKVSYDREHIKTALNVPFINAKTDVKNIEAIVKKVSTKSIILYSYTTYTQATAKAAIIFLQHGVQTKILRIGWNEWRHFSNTWIPENKWQTMQVDSYVEGEANH